MSMSLSYRRRRSRKCNIFLLSRHEFIVKKMCWNEERNFGGGEAETMCVTRKKGFLGKLEASPPLPRLHDQIKLNRGSLISSSPARVIIFYLRIPRDPFETWRRACHVGSGFSVFFSVFCCSALRDYYNVYIHKIPSLPSFWGVKLWQFLFLDFRFSGARETFVSSVRLTVSSSFHSFSNMNPN